MPTMTPTAMAAALLCDFDGELPLPAVEVGPADAVVVLAFDGLRPNGQ